MPDSNGFAGFGATSTTDQVLAGVDLSGKRVLVTGVSAGLGVETARALAARGAHVIGAARDLAKAESAMEQAWVSAKNGGGVELIELDLASLASVRACADRLVAAGKPLDLVINIDVPTDTILHRIAGRRVCVNCGASYHLTSRPTVNWTCDVCGGEVVQRDDDTEAAVATRRDLVAKPSPAP